MSPATVAAEWRQGGLSSRSHQFRRDDQLSLTTNPHASDTLHRFHAQTNQLDAVASESGNWQVLIISDRIIHASEQVNDLTIF